MVQMYRGTDIGNKYTDTKEGKEAWVRWEIRIDIYTTMYEINN